MIDAAGYDSQGCFKRFALRSRSDKYYPSALARYKTEFTIRYARPSGNPVEWNKLFEMELPVKLTYGWCENGCIGDYVILDVPVLQLLHQQGHLERWVEYKRRNMNGRASTLVPISIPTLMRLPDAEGLIVYHSDNHPAI